MTDKTTQTLDDKRHLKHFEWLEREQRHDCLDDAQLVTAHRRGWITIHPGIMKDRRLVRVQLTESGRKALYD